MAAHLATGFSIVVNFNSVPHRLARYSRNLRRSKPNLSWPIPGLRELDARIIYYLAVQMARIIYHVLGVAFAILQDPHYGCTVNSVHPIGTIAEHFRHGMDSQGDT